MASKYQLINWSYLLRYSQKWVDTCSYNSNSSDIITSSSLCTRTRWSL